MNFDPDRLAGMTPLELLDEIERLNRLIGQVAAAPRKISGWDKFVWAGGVVLIVAGAAVAGPLTPAAFLISGLGLGLIGVDAVKKVGEIKGDVEIRALLAQLRNERAIVENEYRSRP